MNRMIADGLMNRHQRPIFVGGVHGVGKTTLSRCVAKLLGAEHVTAGDLIRSVAAESHIASQAVEGKAVLNVDANQDRLLRGLDAYRADRRHAHAQSSRLILDGHFCLLDTAEQIREIPFAVFDAIQPIAVLLVEAKPETIARRLVTRDGSAFTIETLRTLTVLEHAHAVFVASRLQVPLYRASGDEDVESTSRLVAEQLSHHLASEAD